MITLSPQKRVYTFDIMPWIIMNKINARIATMFKIILIGSYDKWKFSKSKIINFIKMTAERKRRRMPLPEGYTEPLTQN